MDEEAIFVAALERKSEVERNAFLDGACVGDSQLRNRVDSLLKSHEEAGTFLNEPAVPVATILQPIAAEAAGTQIGPYKIREQLGEGGMGVVYVAEQTEPVRRKVALKVIKPGMDSKEVIARFEAERQALAMMSHSNIAKVLDGGTTDEGRPYFVMELVKGIPITQFCDEQKLSMRERLELFVTICQAVQHAHHKGIIHRDLKPSNVLVELHDVAPVPKVIDFGIAKATNQQLTQQTVYTQFAQLVGTPLYMSPEQAQLSGLDVDTRSDVYSLGVMLYELLAGMTPFDESTLSSVGLDEMRRIIREDDPPRPSYNVSTLQQEQISTISVKRQTDPRQLSLSMKRELDWIVMKALEKDRTRRYESASDLADDIQRYLKDETVQACPPSVGYKLKKYAKRHKGLLTTLTLMAATLLIATGVSVSYAILAEQSAEEARTARDDAEAEKTKAVAAQVESETNFAAALDAIDRLLMHASSDELAEVPEAQHVRKQFLEDVLEFYGQFEISTDDAPNLRYRVADTWLDLAQSNALFDQFDRAQVAFGKSLQQAEQLAHDYPEEAEYQRLYATALRWLGHFHLHKTKNLEVAFDYLQQEKHLIDDLLSRDPGHTEEWLSLRQDWLRMMTVHAEKNGQREDQLEYARDAYELLKELSIDTNPIGRVRTINSLARALENTAPDRAGHYFQEALDLSQSWAEPNSQSDLMYNRIVVLHNAFDYYWQVDPEFAADLILEATDLSNRLALQNPHIKLHRQKIRSTGLRISQLENWFFQEFHFDSGMMESLQRLVKLTRNAETIYDPKAIDLIFSHVLYALGREEAADIAFDRAKSLSKSDQEKEELFTEQGDYHFKTTGDYQTALKAYNKVIEIRGWDHGPKHLWSQLKRRGWTHFLLGNFAAALDDLTIAIEQDLLGSSTFSFIDFGIVAKCQDEEFLKGLLPVINRKIEIADHWEARRLRGALLFADGQEEQALADFTKAVELQNFEADTEPFFVQRGVLLARVGQFSLADHDFARASELNPDGWSAPYWRALIALHERDFGRYRDLCRKMVEQFQNSETDLARAFMVWTCALAPNAVDDDTVILNVARDLVEREPDNQQFLQNYGAILYRAGQFDPAKQQLMATLELGASRQVSTAYIHYPLAMTETSRGNDGEARSSLDVANVLAEAELSGNPSWNRRLTLELLRREAEQQIAPSVASIPPETDPLQAPRPVSRDP